MIRSFLRGALGALLLSQLLACSDFINLLDVTGSENANSGRGAQVFDPYQASASGAIRLSLQMFKDCAMLGNGQMVAKNSAPIPYPDLCPNMFSPDPVNMLAPPTARLTLMAGTNYFLNQLTLNDVSVGVHTNPADLSDAARWITTESRLRNLDWRNLGRVHDDWTYMPPMPGLTLGHWSREVYFDNANWQKVKDDTFTLEVLDGDGKVRTSISYSRAELLVAAAEPGHSRFSWRMENVLPPRFPGDTEVRPLPMVPGMLPSMPTFRTIARLDLVGSTNPFKSFRIGDLRGDGALRLTWSQLPDEPFYFPVTFVAPSELPATCFNRSGAPTPCGFGLEPNLNFVKPRNGKFYEPGEEINMVVDARDGDGNALHPPDRIPSSSEIASGNANGVLSGLMSTLVLLSEFDQNALIGMSGPLHKMKVRSDPLTKSPFLIGDLPWSLIEELGPERIMPGLFFSGGSTQVVKKLPPDAEPGTYLVVFKLNRYFMGERIAKIKPYFIQVGQEEHTSYPGQVGNCQICHRGVLSLDNLRHGLPVDHVEGCKTCHAYAVDGFGRFQETIHRIHMRSPKYKAPKNDCTYCHLQRESAVRPSLVTCGTCHPTAHGDKYFQNQFTVESESSRFSNCAETCHGGSQTPKNHILPNN